MNDINNYIIIKSKKEAKKVKHEHMNNNLSENILESPVYPLKLEKYDYNRQKIKIDASGANSGYDNDKTKAVEIIHNTNENTDYNRQNIK